MQIERNPFDKMYSGIVTLNTAVTREPAIVDYIKLQENYGDEGILIESLQTYQNRKLYV